MRPPLAFRTFSVVAAVLSVAGAAGSAAPLAAGALPEVSPVSAWERGTWTERLAADRARSPVVRLGPSGKIRPGLASRWREGRDRSGAPCWKFRVPGGQASRIVDDWSVRLAAGDAALADLLGGVRGAPGAVVGGTVPGLRAEGGTLWVCSSARDPWLPARIAHPAAWPAIPARTGGSPDPAFEASFGRDVDRADAPRRAEPWDVTWALWLNPEARWTADPTFRAWLAHAIDRDDLARSILAGHGRSARGLLEDPDAAEPPAPAVRPFSDGARPRIAVAHDAGDPVAAGLASRLKARLGEVGVEVDVAPVGRLPFEAVGRERHPAAILFAHRPAVADPALGLLETVAGLGPSAGVAADALRRRPFDEVDARTARARAVQDDLLGSARLIPLVRGEAWVSGDLGRRRPAPDGRLAPVRGSRP